MNPSFSSVLIQVRERSGFKSALKFHAHLRQSGGIDVNYAQYKKIESGVAIARAEFVSRLSRALPAHGEELVRAYCADLFPDHREIFATGEGALAPSPVRDRPLLHAQDELNARQIALIVASEIHYELYLILALARKSVSLEAVRESLPGLKTKTLEDFAAARLLYVDGEGKYASASLEWKFPEATTEALRSAYAKMSEWDLRFQTKHHFNRVYSHVLLRRVSLRYLPLLKRQAELMADLLRASDEVDPAKNGRVVSLVVQLREGRLPG